VITTATLHRIHLPPELIPDTRTVSLTAGTEPSPFIDFRGFEPLMLQLVDVAVEQDSDVQLWINADERIRHRMDCGAMPDQEPAPWVITATEFLRYKLYSSVDKPSYRTYYGLWAYRPTVAHKLKHGLRLTPEEAQIAESLKLDTEVASGLRPLPLAELIEREYQVLHREVHTVSVDLDTTLRTIGTVVPLRPRDELLVLRSISAAPGTTVQNIRLSVSRDTDENIVSEVETYPMALNRAIDCFVPALNELRFSAQAASSVSGHAFRFVIWRCLLTDILRIRFGLVSKDEVSAELWDQVKGGML